jgi:hypothetical protein
MKRGREEFYDRFAHFQDVAEQLQAIAEREHRPMDEVIRAMIAQYAAANAQPLENTNPFAGLIGLLDDETDADDLSSTVRETLAKYTHSQYGWTKRGRTD